MQQRLHPTTAAVVLGVLWCCWHAPQFLTREWDTPRGSVSDLAAYLIFVIAISVVLSWVTNVARGSILLAILGHTSLGCRPTQTPAAS